ncbi:MAG TPA: hypothetical protein OIM45_02750 [Clostridiaceae bacterium]|nr:hypothetical protein [Clostridiaceae bacterium]
MKKFGKILLRIFLTFIVIVAIIIAIVLYITEIRITDVAEFVNEENKYKVIFQAVGEPEWPFGRTKVKVTLVNDKNKKIKSFKEYISDDGAVAREENIDVNWYANYVEVILKGGEQEDSMHKLEY